MKINEKILNKLKQLDRIEFRQKFDIIEKQNSLYFSISITIGFVIIFVLLILGNITLYIQDKNLLYINIFKTLFISWGLSLILAMIIDSIILFRMFRQIKELEEEYFKIEVKK
jgi:uncharacterized Tic20 family protein